jgi:hypothetical protein
MSTADRFVNLAERPPWYPWTSAGNGTCVVATVAIVAKAAEEIENVLIPPHELELPPDRNDRFRMGYCPFTEAEPPAS